MICTFSWCHNHGFVDHEVIIGGLECIAQKHREQGAVVVARDYFLTRKKKLHIVLNVE